MTPALLIPALIVFAQGENPPLDKDSAKLAREVDQRIEAGRALLSAGKANEAIAKYQEAAKLDPKSSWPVSAMAELFLQASKATSPEHVEEYRRNAAALADQAIDLYDLDYIATSVLGELNGAPKESRHIPVPEARKAFEEAEAKFGKHQYEAAIEDYGRALKLDPTYTDAVLYQGDCFFILQRFREAEVRYRRATILEPNYARAWRFLFDCLLKQRLWDDLEMTGREAIAAEPDDFTVWGRLRQAREASAKKGLKRFAWPKVGRVKSGADGKGVEIQVAMPEGEAESLDGALALSVLMTRAAVLGNDPKTLKELGLDTLSAFQRELRAWTMALDVLEGHMRDGKTPKVDSAWLQLRDMKRTNQLEAGLFLLAFKPEFRPDFETWKQKNPRGIEGFIEMFGLRP